MIFWMGSLIASILLNTYISCIVYFRNQSRIPNRRFPLLALNLIAWNVVTMLVMLSHDKGSMESLIKLVTAVSAFIPTTFYLFISGFFVLPYAKETQKQRLIQLIYVAVSLLNVFIVLQPSFIRELRFPSKTPGFPGPDVEYGKIFLLFVACIIIQIVYGLRTLYRRMKEVTGSLRTEIQYIFFAVIVGASITIGTTLIAPLLGNTLLARFGSIAPIFMNIIMAYAIVRYRIMEISFIIEKTVILGLVSSVLLVVYLFFVGLSSRIISMFFNGQTMAPVLIGSFIVAIAFTPLKEFLQKKVKKRIFSEGYNLDSFIVRMRGVLNSAANVSEKFSLMKEVLFHHFKMSGKLLVLVGKTDAFGAKTLFQFGKLENCDVLPAYDSAIIHDMKSDKFTLYREELIRFSGRTEVRSVLDEMTQLGCEVAVPLIIKNNIVGAFLLPGGD